MKANGGIMKLRDAVAKNLSGRTGLKETQFVLKNERRSFARKELPFIFLRRPTCPFLG
jgi:hypothetical protein